MNTEITNDAVIAVLRHPKPFNWTTQGFGMIRCYLDDKQRFRLNIWDYRMRTPGVSLIHDHPWSFTSTIYAGRILNKRYYFSSNSELPFNYYYKHIVTGPDGDDASEVMECRLIAQHLETYKPGQSYTQKLTEVHETDAEIGTVTVNDRTPPTNEYTARVFWHKNGHPWMAARPRPSTDEEIAQATWAALEKFGCA